MSPHTLSINEDQHECKYISLVLILVPIIRHDMTPPTGEVLLHVSIPVKFRLRGRISTFKEDLSCFCVGGATALKRGWRCGCCSEEKSSVDETFFVLRVSGILGRKTRNQELSEARQFDKSE
jgi:hypothetical protein